MIESFLSRLAQARSLTLCPAASSDSFRQLRRQYRIELPRNHIQLLSTANGIMVYGGFFRLFGVGCEHCIDMIKWNNPTTWKFAWANALDDYWCFGETAFGDQYAYKMNELGGTKPATVYLLEHVTMTSEIIANNIDDFLANEFARCAESPYYEFHIQSRAKVGDLDWHEHVAHVPSLLISGEELIDNVAKMEAIATMIINGDLAVQLAGELVDRGIRSLEPYEDGNGKIRIRVLWR